MPTGREQWFAGVLEAGLETAILAEPDILSHATPAVLAGALPRDVLVRVFDAALATGTMSPKVIVSTATPAQLATSLPAIMLWGCIGAAADRAGITSAAGTDKAEARTFLRKALERAIEGGLITPKDIVRHVDAKVLGHLPEALTTKLLEASLAAGKMTPEIVVETLGTEAIAKHVPTSVIWACLSQMVESPPATATAAPEPSLPPRIPEAVRPAETRPPETRPTPAKPGLEFLDDDVASVLVDLDDSSVMVVETIEKAVEKEKPKKGFLKRT